MQTKSDAELLRGYTGERSEAAFSEIVRRYAGFVYSAALRQVGNSEPARDVAQTVFSHLARKAALLPPNTLLMGWLCHATRLASLEQLRRDNRRLQRERQAMEWHEASSEIAPAWEEVRPALDEGMASLHEQERDALLLRFFKGESLASVGAALGVSEDAAQKRVSRALEKLREFFAAKGIRTTAASLSGVMVANSVEGIPTGLAASLSSAAMANAIVTNSVPFPNLFTLTKMKYAILTLVLAAAIAAVEYKHLRTHQQIQQERSAANRQEQEIQTLRGVHDRLADETNELQRLRMEANDVARLREEAGKLRQEQAALKKLNAEMSQTITNIAPEEPQILITARFISAPTDILSGVAWPKPNDGGTVLMDDQQLKMMLEDLKIVEGMELLSQPRISTGNGAQASLSTTRQVSMGGTNVSIGESLMVNPHYSDDSRKITLDIAAKSNRLIDLSRAQDESQLDLQTTTITNSMMVLDGQSLLLRKDVQDKGRGVGSTNLLSGPKSILVVLTPQLVRADGNLYRLEHVVNREIGRQ